MKKKKKEKKKKTVDKTRPLLSMEGYYIVRDACDYEYV